MKKNFLKPIAAVAIAGITMFSCASTNDGYSNTGTNDTMGGTETTGTTGTMGDTGTTTGTMDDAGTTTTGSMGDMGTTTGTMDDAGTTGTMTTDTEMMNETGAMTTDTERMANTTADYDQLFATIENTEQYGALELARRDPNFSTFVQLVELSGLSRSFEEAGPVTVFMPTNEAFNEMDRGEFNRLTDPQNRTDLINFINLHVLNSEVGSAQFGTRQVIETGNGTQIPVTATAGPGATPTSPGLISIGGADIVRSDIDVSNGIVHVVNGVISPEEVTGPGERR